MFTSDTRMGVRLRGDSETDKSGLGEFRVQARAELRLNQDGNLTAEFVFDPKHLV